MRIAATADLHFAPQSATVLRDQLDKVRDEADLLIVAGDLTNYGRPTEMEPLLNTFVRLRIPIVAVLGNHDYESEQTPELLRMMTAAGIKVLDGSAYERDGVGFAGTKGFVGGFGRGILTAFGEPEIKAFVRASIDEALKLERAMSQLRTSQTHRRTALCAHSCDHRRRSSGDLTFSWNFTSGRGNRPAWRRSGCARTCS